MCVRNATRAGVARPRRARCGALPAAVEGRVDAARRRPLPAREEFQLPGPFPVRAEAGAAVNVVIRAVISREIAIPRRRLSYTHEPRGKSGRDVCDVLVSYRMRHAMLPRLNYLLIVEGSISGLVFL